MLGEMEIPAQSPCHSSKLSFTELLSAPVRDSSSKRLWKLYPTRKEEQEAVPWDQPQPLPLGSLFSMPPPKPSTPVCSHCQAGGALEKLELCSEGSQAHLELRMLRAGKGKSDGSSWCCSEIRAEQLGKGNFSAFSCRNPPLAPPDPHGVPPCCDNAEVPGRFGKGRRAQGAVSVQSWDERMGCDPNCHLLEGTGAGAAPGSVPGQAQQVAGIAGEAPRSCHPALAWGG